MRPEAEVRQLLVEIRNDLDSGLTPLTQKPFDPPTRLWLMGFRDGLLTVLHEDDQNALLSLIDNLTTDIEKLNEYDDS